MTHVYLVAHLAYTLLQRVVASEDPTATWLRLRSHLGMADLFGATVRDSSHPSSDSDSSAVVQEKSTPAKHVVPTQSEEEEEHTHAMLRINLGHGDCCDIPAALVLPTAKLEFRGVHVGALNAHAWDLSPLHATFPPHSTCTVLDECAGGCGGCA